MSAGSVVNVEEQRAGSELAVDAGSGAGTITVEDPTDFQPDGGELLIGTEEHAYSVVTEETGLIDLDGTLASAYLTGEPVFVLPGTIERFAHVQLEGQDEALLARVPHGLYDRLPVGIRDENADELELVEVDRDPGGELIVADVLEREPAVDASYIDPDSTVPPAALTDGVAPTSSPTPSVLGGVLSLFVQWLAIANPDPVTYEVHLSTSSGFTPSGSSYCGETRGTLFVIRALPGTLNPPVYGTTYYVKVVAKDADGSGPASAEDSATPEEGMQDAIIADLIAANAIIAEKLETVLAIATTIVAGTLNGPRVEVGVATDETMGGMLGIHAMGLDGVTPTFMVDGSDGSVYLKGLVEWGSASALLSDDILELQQQPTGSFATPSLIQSAGGKTDGDQSSVSASWTTTTRNGSLLLAVLGLVDTDGTPPTPTTPSGWTLIPSSTVTQNDMKLLVYKIENATPRSGVQTITLGDSVRAVLQLFEYGGTGVQDVTAVTASGNSTSPSTGTSGTTTQAEELWLGIIGVYDYPSPPTDFGPAAFSSPTNGYTLLRSDSAPAPHVGTFPTLRVDIFSKNVVATGTAGMGGTLAQAEQWAGIALTFKAKVAGVEAPPTSKVRLYGRQAGGETFLHTMNDQTVEGSVVIGTAGEVWRLETITRNFNPPNVGAHGGNVTNFASISGLSVGDLVVACAPTVDPGNRGVHFFAETDVTTAGTITMWFFNTDSVALDHPSMTFRFLILHRGSP